MNKPHTAPEDPFEEAADSLIEDCDGNARQAVFALLGEREYLLGRIEALEATVSWGFVRAGVERK